MRPCLTKAAPRRPLRSAACQRAPGLIPHGNERAPVGRPLRQHVGLVPPNLGGGSQQQQGIVFLAKGGCAQREWRQRRCRYQRDEWGRPRSRRLDIAVQPGCGGRVCCPSRIGARERGWCRRRSAAQSSCAMLCLYCLVVVLCLCYLVLCCVCVVLCCAVSVSCAVLCLCLVLYCVCVVLCCAVSVSCAVLCLWPSPSALNPSQATCNNKGSCQQRPCIKRRPATWALVTAFLRTRDASARPLCIL